MNRKVDGSYGFLLTKCTQTLHRQLNRNFISNGFDITIEQWSILICLHSCETKSQYELAEMTYKDKVSVTKIVDNLEKRNLVYRALDKNDRRRKKIFLTEEGKNLIPKLRKIAISTLQEGFADINSEDIESFKKVLSKVVENFTGNNLLEFININKGRWKL